MVKRSELQVDGYDVYIKQYTGGDCGGSPHYNWERIARFSFVKDGPTQAEMLKSFIDSIACE